MKGNALVKESDKSQKQEEGLEASKAHFKLLQSFAVVFCFILKAMPVDSFLYNEEGQTVAL